MIDWLTRADPQRPFLKTNDRVWSYGETLDEVMHRVGREHRILRPGLDLWSVFDIVAGLAGGGLTVLGQDAAETTDHAAKLVVYTSGTSGRPKGVRLTLDNLTTASQGSVEHLGHGQDDTWLLMMPLHHVAGLSIIVRSLYAGGSVRLQSGFDPTAFLDAINGDVSMVSVVPTMLHRILEVDSPGGADLRAVLVGGGPIPGGLLERAAELGLPVLPTYGMTETFGQLATLRPGSELVRAVDPLPGVDIRIESDGRIAVKGDQVSPGYVGEPDRPDPWFVTDDLGEIVAGRLRVLGRADSVIVTGGENVAPERVEAELLEHDLVFEAMVVGMPDEEWGERLCCVVVSQADSEGLGLWLRERLPGHMVPKEWRHVARIPRTGLGKPDRTWARALF